MRRQLPSIQALICFESAAKHASFTKAAQELALTQGAVSRQVSSLEDMLGVSLFKRDRHGMQLTQTGERYYKNISNRLHGLERDTLDIMGGNGLGNNLTIAAVPTFASRWLVPRLTEFSKLFPTTHIHIETRTRAFMFNDSGMDAAIYAGTPEQVLQWAGTEATKLFDEEVIPVCSPSLLKRNRPLTPEQISKMPLLQQSTRPEAWRQWFNTQGLDPSQSMAGPRYEQFSMQVAAAQCGLGVSLMPTILVTDELATGQLVVACNKPLSGLRAYYFVQPQSALQLEASVHFKKWLSQQFSSNQD
jgi:DNA-binding transcriptional LysR family regulator